MTIGSRIREWWVSRWRGTGKLGKGAMLIVPLLLGCCSLTMLTAVLAPEPEPTRAATPVVLVTRTAAGATSAAVDATATELPVRAPATATENADAGARVVEPADIPTRERTATPRATAEPSSTPRPTETATSRPVVAATAVAATVAAAQPTAAPVTSTSAPATALPPTAIPPTAAPTQLPSATGTLVIVGVDKRAEVVTIRNDGGAEVNLGGWVLRSERGSQDCALGGVIGPGQVLQIWAMAEDAGQGGFNCGFGSNIWNNDEPDAAILIDPSGVVVSRW